VLCRMPFSPGAAQSALPGLRVVQPGQMRSIASGNWLFGRLFLRGQRFVHPAVKLLLVGFDPAVDVALDICF